MSSTSSDNYMRQNPIRYAFAPTTPPHGPGVQAFLEQTPSVGMKRLRGGDDQEPTNQRIRKSVLDKLKEAVSERKTRIILPCKCVVDETSRDWRDDSTLPLSDPFHCPNWECGKVLKPLEIDGGSLRMLLDEHGGIQRDEQNEPIIVEDAIPKTVSNETLKKVIATIYSSTFELDVMNSLNEQLKDPRTGRVDRYTVALPCGHAFGSDNSLHNYKEGQWNSRSQTLDSLPCFEEGCSKPIKTFLKDPTLEKVCGIVRGYNLKQAGITVNDLSRLPKDLQSAAKDNLENVVRLKASGLLSKLIEAADGSTDMFHIQNMAFRDVDANENIIGLGKAGITPQDLGRIDKNLQRKAVQDRHQNLISIKQSGFWDDFIALGKAFRAEQEEEPQGFSFSVSLYRPASSEEQEAEARGMDRLLRGISAPPEQRAALEDPATYIASKSQAVTSSSSSDI